MTWKRLKWYQRIKEGDQFLFLEAETKNWIKCGKMIGQLVWGAIVIRPSEPKEAEKQIGDACNEQIKLCCSDLPKDTLEMNNRLWRAFNAGRKYEKYLT